MNRMARDKDQGARMKKPGKQRESRETSAGETPSPNGDLQHRIRRRAYELWEQGGCQHGRDVEHWLRAEHELSNGQSDDRPPVRT
jgi:hypothetical protein